MLIKELKEAINEDYQDGIKRQLRDALISLKIQGNKKVSTVAVLRDFARRGMEISISELLDLLQDDPMIQDVNREEIIFSQDEANPNPEHEEVEDEALKYNVKRMARKAVNKRLRIGR